MKIILISDICDLTELKNLLRLDSKKTVTQSTATVDGESANRIQNAAVERNSNQTWNHSHTSRIQSMVVHDGSIILCENEGAIETSTPHIEFVEVLSPANHIHGKTHFCFIALAL